MRHREAYAVEKTAPTRAGWQRQGAEASEKRRAENARRLVEGESTTTPQELESVDNAPRETLIVVSKLKKYIRARSGMNTSDTVLPALSEHVRRLCDEAIRNAGASERKTVLDRDIPRPPEAK